MKRELNLLLILVMSFSMLIAGCGESSNNVKQEAEVKSWEPSKSIEWVVTSSPGGGSDIFTRTIMDIMQKENIVSQPIIITYQTDGGGEVGRRQVSQAKDDGHMLLTFNSGDLMPMVQNTDLRIENFKPIAIMAVDRQLLLKGTKTKYADFAEGIAAAKSGTQVVIGGSKGDDVLTYNKMLESLGLDDTQMAYIMYDSTSEALTALMGGHVDFAISKPAAAMQYIESKDMEPVVALSSEHFSGILADVPLLSEVGDYEDVECPVWRGVVAPASTPDEAVEFWSDALRKVSETEKWQKDYIEKYMLTSKYMPFDEAAKYMKDYQEDYLKTLEK